MRGCHPHIIRPLYCRPQNGPHHPPQEERCAERTILSRAESASCLLSTGHRPHGCHHCKTVGFIFPVWHLMLFFVSSSNMQFWLCNINAIISLIPSLGLFVHTACHVYVPNAYRLILYLKLQHVLQYLTWSRGKERSILGIRFWELISKTL